MRRASLLLALLAGACEEPPAETPPVPPPPVHVVEVRAEQVTPTAEGVATLEAARDATLRAEAPGRVVEVAAEPGQRVEAGDVLVRLDVGRTTVALQAASAQGAQAEARVAQAEREAELARRLVASGGAPERRGDDAEDAVRLARAALDAAQAQTRLTRRGLTEAVVRAPFPGTVAERFVEVGEYVGPGAPVAQVVDTSHLEARVLLDPRRALDVPIGARARVHAFARPEEVFEAEVERVGEVVDPRSRRLPVELRVDDPERRLRPGLAARFVVETGAPEEHLVLADGAVFERFGQRHVYVVDGEGVAERRAVELGPATGERLTVLGGVEAGERVVVEGVDRVVHQRPVQIVEQAAEQAAEQDAEAVVESAAEAVAAAGDE